MLLQIFHYITPNILDVYLCLQKCLFCVNKLIVYEREYYLLSVLLAVLITIFIIILDIA